LLNLTLNSYTLGMANEVTTNVDDDVLIITINRPKARNALNAAAAAGIATAVDRLDEDDSLRAAVLTGAGGTFCSGMDLKAFLTGESPDVPGRGLAGITQARPRKPLIAAVEGYALAGGLEIALACDMIVSGRSAKFGLPEVRRALVAAAGGVLILPQRIPMNVAMEMVLTGDPIDAARAYDLGLVNTVTDDGGALDVARDFAHRIARNGPLAVAASKYLVHASQGWSDSERWAKQDGVNAPIFSSEDAREGARAFAEKRDPVWNGR
jgi:enoyl-CoA hydratase